MLTDLLCPKVMQSTVLKVPSDCSISKDVHPETMMSSFVSITAASVTLIFIILVTIGTMLPILWFPVTRSPVWSKALGRKWRRSASATGSASDVWLTPAVPANLVSRCNMFPSHLLISRLTIGKKDLEQVCPDSCLTYNSTELDKKTPTYGGESALWSFSISWRRWILLNRLLECCHGSGSFCLQDSEESFTRRSSTFALCWHYHLFAAT